MSVRSVQGLRLFSTLCTISAVILSSIAFTLCDFIKQALTYGSDVEPNEISLHYGIFNYQTWTMVSSTQGAVIFQGCWSYPDYVEVDSEWKAARAFAVMSLIFGYAFMFAELFSACLNGSGKDQTYAPASGKGFIFCSLCTGLSLLMLGSDMCKENELTKALETYFPNDEMNVAKCGISTGANCAISATVLWFAAGVSSFYAMKMENLEDIADDDRKVYNAGLEEPLFREDA